MNPFKSFRPLRDKILVHVEPDATHSPGGLKLPQKDTIRYCPRCGGFAEALSVTRCIPEPIFELEKRRDLLHYRGDDDSHQIEYATRISVYDGVRPALVLASAADDVKAGERVLIQTTAGTPLPDDEPMSPFRVVSIDVVMAKVEDDDAAA